MENSREEALRAAAAGRGRVAEVAEKIRSGDLRGAFARVGFALADLAELLGHLTAAHASANQAGYLPPLPAKPAGDARCLWCVLIHDELSNDLPETLQETAGNEVHEQRAEGVHVFDGGGSGVLVTAPTRERLREVLEPSYEHPDMGGCLEDLMSSAFEVDLPDAWIGGSSLTHLGKRPNLQAWAFCRQWLDVVLDPSAGPARQAAAAALSRARLEHLAGGFLDAPITADQLVDLLCARLDEKRANLLRAAVREAALDL